MKISAILAFVVCLMFVPVSMAQKKVAVKPFTTSGDYNGINMSSKESGDYYGMDVFLTESDGQLYAVVTTAEGGFSTPVLVEAKQSGKDMRTVEFTLPGENGDRKYKGTVSATRFSVVGSDGLKFVMKRECGNLTSNITMGKGGDYGGMEVYLAEGGGDSYVLVTVAEGVLKRPVLVPAKVSLKQGAIQGIDFELSGENGGRKFKGKLTKTGMTLTEGSDTLVLKSKCYK